MRFRYANDEDCNGMRMVESIKHRCSSRTGSTVGSIPDYFSQHLEIIYCRCIGFYVCNVHSSPVSEYSLHEWRLHAAIIQELPCKPQFKISRVF